MGREWGREWGLGDEVESWQGTARLWIYSPSPGGPVRVLLTWLPLSLSPRGLRAHRIGLPCSGS